MTSVTPNVPVNLNQFIASRDESCKFELCFTSLDMTDHKAQTFHSRFFLIVTCCCFVCFFIAYIWEMAMVPVLPSQTAKVR